MLDTQTQEHAESTRLQETLLSMRGISKAFSGVSVLSDVCFDLRAGEVHILAGENGAGKSTLIKILAGVHRDYQGTIELHGKRVRFASPQDAARRGISVIHQEMSLVGAMSVADNIFLGREIVRGTQVVDRRSQREQSRRLLEQFGLQVDVSAPVENYPVSVQQMIEIAKALAFRARVLVMDEPTSALSEPEVERLFALIARLKAEGCGIIYISHKMQEIYTIADRITVLRDGAYIATARAAQLPPSELVRWMVGRELTQQFPETLSSAGGERLVVENLSVKDPARAGNYLVQDVSFRACRGEVVGIAGLQGSGNSELLNALFGVYGRRVTGRVLLDGKPYAMRSPRFAIGSGVGLLTNDRKATGLVLSMSIRENMTLAALGKFSPGGWLRRRREKSAASACSSELRVKAASLEQEVGTLSGGNQQKVALGKWIQIRPRLLLLDEPTRGVDVGAKHEIYELMNQWKQNGCTILLITSEMPELLAMSDRILVMHRGAIRAHFLREEATQEKILEAAMG